MQAQTFAVIIAVAILITVIELIRRQKMTFKYSLLWLTATLMVVFFACSQKFLFNLSTWFGFELPSNFIFFLFLVFFVFLSLFLTLYINEQNTRTESLAQSLAMLEHKLNRLQNKKS